MKNFHITRRCRRVTARIEESVTTDVCAAWDVDGTVKAREELTGPDPNELTARTLNAYVFLELNPLTCATTTLVFTPRDSTRAVEPIVVDTNTAPAFTTITSGELPSCGVAVTK